MEVIELTVSKQGEIVIPTSFRKQLAIDAGSKLLVYVEESRLIMETRKQLWQSIHKACSKIKANRDLAEELTEERREMAKKENV